MQNITLGDIATVLAFIVGLIGSIEFLLIRIKKMLDNQLKPIRDEITDESIQRLKANLVNYMALAEQDMLIGKQREVAYEEYDKYTNKYKQNSYVHSEWERLQKANKL